MILRQAPYDTSSSAIKRLMILRQAPSSAIKPYDTNRFNKFENIMNFT
jgi:hypothetical protein